MTPEYRYTLRKHYGRLSLALLVYYVVTNAAQFAAQYAVMAWMPAWAEAGWFLPALAFLPMYCIGFPIFLWLLPKAPPRELMPEKRSIPGRELIPILLMCLGILYPGNLLGQGLDWLLRRVFHSSGGGSSLDVLANSSSTWAFFLVAVVLAPVMEELTFRKLLLDRMRPIDKPSALLFTALAFGLFHSNIVQFFYAFGVGVIFGCIYLRTGRIAYSMVLHVIINFLGSAAVLFLMGDLDLTNLDPAALMEHLLPLLGLGIYALVLIAGSIAGIVLLIRHRRSLRVADEGDRLGSSSRFTLVFCRPGWLLYCLAALAVIVISYRI
jgi:CAAX amino terminal protease family.